MTRCDFTSLLQSLHPTTTLETSAIVRYFPIRGKEPAKQTLLPFVPAFGTMDGFKRALEAARLPPGSMLTVDLEGEEVLLVNVAGKYYGMGAVCKHAEWDLSEGMLEGTKVTCAGHGTIWDLETGIGEYEEPLENEPLYDVKAEGGYLYVKRRT